MNVFSKATRSEPTKKRAGRAKPSVAYKPIKQQETISRQQIEQRAYYLWVEKGRPHGQDMEDWLKAETQLRKEIHQA